MALHPPPAAVPPPGMRLHLRGGWDTHHSGAVLAGGQLSAPGRTGGGNNSHGARGWMVGHGAHCGDATDPGVKAECTGSPRVNLHSLL